MIDPNNFNTLIPQSEKFLMGNFHPITFPINYLEIQNIYVPNSLYNYDALNMSVFGTDSLILIPGQFQEINENFVIFKACPENCVKCISLGTCLECSSNNYISNGKCRPCAEDCSDCRSHAQKCLSCSSPNIIASGRYFSFLNCSF